MTATTTPNPIKLYWQTETRWSRLATAISIRMGHTKLIPSGASSKPSAAVVPVDRAARWAQEQSELMSVAPVATVACPPWCALDAGHPYTGVDYTYRDADAPGDPHEVNYSSVAYDRTHTSIRLEEDENRAYIEQGERLDADGTTTTNELTLSFLGEDWTEPDPDEVDAFAASLTAAARLVREATV